MTRRQLEARKYYAMRPRLPIREICERMGGISKQWFYRLLKCSTRDRHDSVQRKLERHFLKIRKQRARLSIQRLASYYSVSEGAMTRFLEKHGITNDYDLRRRDEQTRREVVAARKAGMTHSEIRERWGVHPPTTNRWVAKDS